MRALDLIGKTEEKPPPEQEQPFGVSEVTTPSGLSIYYQAGPKRLYRLNGEEVPSVSQVLDILEKGGLSWWGMKVGIQGVFTLANEHGREILVGDTVEDIVDLFKQHKLTVNDVKGKAADRGTNVHTALETWVSTGVTPDPRFFPQSERGYVQGLVAFINDAHPFARQSELMVASTDGYAGRFDLFAHLDGEVVTKTYPKRSPIRANVSGAWLLDLKTSKSVYSSYHLQLAAYDHAMSECGYGEADEMGVVRVTADGRYELVVGKAGYVDFLHILSAYRVLKSIA